eukprot:1292453-Pyramimonas_sp.AAC.2
MLNVELCGLPASRISAATRTLVVSLRFVSPKRSKWMPSDWSFSWYDLGAKPVKTSQSEGVKNR